MDLFFDEVLVKFLACSCLYLCFLNFTTFVASISERSQSSFLTNLSSNMNVGNDFKF